MTRQSWKPLVVTLSSCDAAYSLASRQRFARDRAGTDRVSRVAREHRASRPPAPLQANGHGVRVGDLHARPEYHHLLRHLHARHAAGHRRALPDLRVRRPLAVELLLVLAELRPRLAHREQL